MRAGLTFDVRDEGPRDGEPVVLLHGFPQTSVIWTPLGGRLRAAGYRTLAPDQRGYSPGARPRGVRPYALPELVADALAVLDAATADRAHLVAHDWGAGVAWALAARHPDRVASLTSLSSPPPQALLRGLLRPRQALAAWYIAVIAIPGWSSGCTPGGRTCWSGCSNAAASRAPRPSATSPSTGRRSPRCSTGTAPCRSVAATPA